MNHSKRETTFSKTKIGNKIGSKGIKMLMDSLTNLSDLVWISLDCKMKKRN